MNKLLSRQYELRDHLRSMLLLAGMVFLLGLLGWLLAGVSGMVGSLLVGVFIVMSAPHFTPQFILRLLRAKVLLPEDAPRLYEVVAILSNRAEIKKPPILYYVPGSVINAFTTGLKERAVIVLSDGMLRQLNIRELTGVLAHEISHISHNDLFVMLIADIISRIISVMSMTGYVLILVYMPQFILMDINIPWMLLIVLITAPTFSLLMELALSRVHEFNADIEAAKLTDDPLALASALEKIEYYQGGWIERILMPYRRMREPVLFRSHPLIIERVKRLKQLASQVRSTEYNGRLQ